LAVLPFLLLAAPQIALAQSHLMFPTLGTSDKPQSKLWYNDGTWWTAIDGLAKLSIYQLSGGTWTNKLDLQAALSPGAKGNGTSDALWDGTNLFLAAFDSVTTNIYKLTYNSTAHTYAPVAGFPIALTMRPNAKSLVIDEDSTGRLWATYQGQGQIWVTYTTTADHKTWAPQLSIAAGLKTYDAATVVAFGGDKIGVAYTDEVANRLCFRVHRDTDAPGVWQPREVIRSGFGTVDNHLNAKADPSGRVFLAVKDYYNHIYVTRRNTDGSWTVALGANGLDCATRPVIQLDPSLDRIYLFYTRWEGCISLGAHVIEEREADLDNLVFSLPTVVASATNVAMNDVTGCKQMLPPGCMLIACAGSAKAYWMGWGSVSGIGGSDPGGTIPPPPAPPASLLAENVIEQPSASVMLLRLDEGTGTVATDASGTNHNGKLTGVGGMLPHWAPGLVGSGLFFQGDGYVSASSSALGFVNKSFTLETWVQLDSKSSKGGTGALIARGDSLRGNYFLELTGSLLEFHWSFTDTTGAGVKANGPFQDGAWHHVAAVYDQTATQARLYIDGHLTAIKTTAGPGVTKSFPLTIGAIKKVGSLGSTFRGSLDLVRISGAAVYSTDFTPPLLYPATPKRYPRLRWTAPTTPVGIQNYTIQRVTNGAPPVGAGSSVGSTAWFADLSAVDGSLGYTVQAIDGLGQTGAESHASLAYEGMPPLPPGAPQGLGSSEMTVTVDRPAFYEMNDGTGSASADGTGLAHTAQLGAPAPGDAAEPHWIDGIEGKALRFDGANDYAQIDDRSDLRFAGSFTIEMYLRRNALGGIQALLTKDAGTTKRNYGLSLQADGKLQFSIYKPTPGQLLTLVSTIGITDSEWHHVACTWNSGTGAANLYLDGQPAGAANLPGPIYTGPERILLGAHDMGTGTLGDFFHGDLDLARFSDRVVYSGAFTPPEYYRGGPKRRIVALSWQTPASGLISGYRVFRDVAGGAKTEITLSSSLLTSIIDSTVDPGTYVYTVIARNSASVEGPAATLQVDLAQPTDAQQQTAPPARGAELQIHPNPFNPAAIVSFRLASAGPVQLVLYDVLGRRVETLVNRALPAGEHRVPLVRSDAKRRLASGVYFLRLTADGRDTRIKAVLVQ
jgi:hypothetical protein